MNQIIRYFSSKPIITNMIMISVILGGMMMWKLIGKEEMPEFAMSSVRVSVNYPGASAKDVEQLIIKPIEKRLKLVASIEEVVSTSAVSNASIRVIFSPKTSDLNKKIQEVKDAVDMAILPREAREPIYSQFKSSEKAIIDIGLYLRGNKLLDNKTRQKLQKYAFELKEKIISQPELSGVSMDGYLRPQIHINTKPEVMLENEITMSEIASQVQGQHLKLPVGSIYDKEESDISLVGELDSPESIRLTPISSGFNGQSIELNKLADVHRAFERKDKIIKVMGNEGIIFNVQKSTSSDIISAHQAVLRTLREFQTSLDDKDFGFIFMDDESESVRDRISLIASNGVVGFMLIIIILFIFLDFQSGFWVAAGIPFCLSLTLLLTYLVGYTVNNMTLAAIIIVLGIVVDDAIIVAENIVRGQRQNVPNAEIEGTTSVISPIVASVLTTCAAFIPLYFFDGFFGLLIKYISPIIIFMLIASLFESIFLLPSHIKKKPKSKESKLSIKRDKLIEKLESRYAKFLEKVLTYRGFVLLGFVALFGFSYHIYSTRLYYVMFPREELKEFMVKVVAPKGHTRPQTALLVDKVEKVFLKDQGIVTGMYSTIGTNRRGNPGKTNEAYLVIEIISADKREKTTNELFSGWKKELKEIKDVEAKFIKNRWGSSSGSPIELEIQENNYELRNQVAKELKVELAKVSGLINIDIDRPVIKNEYKFHINKQEVSRLKIDFTSLKNTIRSHVEGRLLYTVNSGDEEVDVILSTVMEKRQDINDLLQLAVENKEGYLIPLEKILTLEKSFAPRKIKRVSYKRILNVYADIDKNLPVTPLLLAQTIERDVLPKVLKGKPSVNIVFKGEVKDSRKSQNEFQMSIYLALGIIYVLLVFLFNSLLMPFLIGATLPFGVIGVIMAFWLHDYNLFGFFAAVGTLGMLGVVINDSIVLIDKLEKSNITHTKIKDLILEISLISSTRLRAIIITTLTTVCGLLPTAYGLAGYDSMLGEMMLAMCWGLLFGMVVTLILIPIVYSYYIQLKNLKGLKNE